MKHRWKLAIDVQDYWQNYYLNTLLVLGVIVSLSVVSLCFLPDMLRTMAFAILLASSFEFYMWMASAPCRRCGERAGLAIFSAPPFGDRLDASNLVLRPFLKPECPYCHARMGEKHVEAGSLPLTAKQRGPLN